CAAAVALLARLVRPATGSASLAVRDPGTGEGDDADDRAEAAPNGVAAVVHLARMADRVQRAHAHSSEEQDRQDDEHDADDGQRPPGAGTAGETCRTHFFLLRRAGFSSGRCPAPGVWVSR